MIAGTPKLDWFQTASPDPALTDEPVTEILTPGDVWTIDVADETFTVNVPDLPGNQTYDLSDLVDDLETEIRTTNTFGFTFIINSPGNTLEIERMEDHEPLNVGPLTELRNHAYL